MKAHKIWYKTVINAQFLTVFFLFFSNYMYIQNILKFLNILLFYGILYVGMKDNLIHARTCVYNVNYHIVWSTKYRRKVLNSKIETRLKEILIQVSKEKEFTIHEMEVGE